MLVCVTFVLCVCVPPLETFPDNAARREVESLQVLCIHEGCAWKGTLKEYEVRARGGHSVFPLLSFLPPVEVGQVSGMGFRRLGQSVGKSLPASECWSRSEAAVPAGPKVAFSSVDSGVFTFKQGQADYSCGPGDVLEALSVRVFSTWKGGCPCGVLMAPCAPCSSEKLELMPTGGTTWIRILIALWKLVEPPRSLVGPPLPAHHSLHYLKACGGFLGRAILALLSCSGRSLALGGFSEKPPAASIGKKGDQGLLPLCREAADWGPS